MGVGTKMGTMANFAPFPIAQNCSKLLSGFGGRGRNRICNLTYFQQHAGQRMTLEAVESSVKRANRARMERRPMIRCGLNLVRAESQLTASSTCVCFNVGSPSLSEVRNA